MAASAPSVPPTHANPCAAEIAAAVAAIVGARPEDVKIDQPPNRALGDFAVPAFPLLKAAGGGAPPALAARIAAELPRGGLIVDATATGPFVNVKVDRVRAIAMAIDAAVGRAALVPDQGQGAVVCIDYSSPNISKHLAYHHIRSTMLGHALVEIFTALGYRVVRINHLGDWGTTHGMLLAAYQRWGAEYATIDVTALNELYVRYRAAMKAEPGLDAEARAWFKRLEDGDPDARARWQQFRDTSLAEFRKVYELLGVAFDDERGESFYEDKMPEILELLAAKGLLEESEGAQVVKIPGDKNPLLIKTGDGTTLYATRDLAAALYRQRTYGFARSLYVVDRGQGLHFKQLFTCLGMLGFDWASRCQHVPFGLVRFGGKKTSTRGAVGGSGGGQFLLTDVIAEAVDEVRPRIAEKNPEMPPAELEAVAHAVGIGAVVFANVVPQRDRDVDFDWEKVTSLSGDSGPYLQYTLARCWNIERKAGELVDGPADWTLLSHDAEWAVARKLLEFGEHVARAAVNCEPHVVAHYLLDLAGEFSRWYTQGNEDASLRVICDDLPTRRARLALVHAVKRTLTRGLAMLGLAEVTRM